MGDIEWTEAHRVEAWARLLELHATKVRERGVTFDVRGTSDLVKDEHATRETLGMFMDAARVDREVRRVDAFATGKLVRETAYFVRDSLGTLRRDFPRTREGLKAARLFIADHVREYPNGRMAMRVVRVARIRRAT